MEQRTENGAEILAPTDYGTAAETALYLNRKHRDLAPDGFGVYPAPLHNRKWSVRATMRYTEDEPVVRAVAIAYADGFRSGKRW